MLNPISGAIIQASDQIPAGRSRVRQLLGGVALAALAMGCPAAFAQPSGTSPQGLGFLTSTDSNVPPNSYAFGVSADGGVVVGYASLTPPIAYEGFRWTPAGGMVALGVLGAGVPGVVQTNSIAQAVSADGTVIVGESTDGTNGGQAFRWTQATGMVGLGFVGNSGYRYSAATGVSTDGSVVVGSSTYSGNYEQAFRWTQAGGTVGLGFLNSSIASPNSAASGVSGDGTIVVGNSYYATNQYEAIRWTQATGMTGLGFVGGGGSSPYSSAYGISQDGTVIVGYSSDASNATQPFRWTQSGGIVGLGLIGGGGTTHYGYANATNADGSIVVGSSSNATNVYEAFRWTQATGIQSLNVLLKNVGVNLGGWTLNSANAITPDGQIIVGYGTDSTHHSEAYLVRYSDGNAGPIGGMTTPASIVNSVNMLGLGRNAIMEQEHGFAAPLLGDNGPITGGGGDDAGIFAAVGSASGGASGRKSLGGGFSVTLGLSVASESYTNANMNDAVLIAASVRYVHDLS